MNDKVYGWSTPLKGKKEGGQLQFKNEPNEGNKYLQDLFIFILSCEIHDIHYMKYIMEELESILYILLH